MKPQIFSINGEMFDDIRLKIDQALNIALRKMTELDIYAGTVNAKLDIQIEKTQDENGDQIIKPEFGGMVEINLPLKGKIKMNSQKGLIMARDPTGAGFLVATEQYTFMDMLEEQETEEG